MFSESFSLPMSEKWKSHIEIAPNCPRCASANTKFCYYNNYSLSQPRYFCKSCRRYWTKGGSLRNVPVGGGCRKNRRSKSSRNTPVTKVSNNYHCSGDATCSSSSEEFVFQENGIMTNRSSDIDLAAVFANFLSSGDAQQDVMVETQNGSDHDRNQIRSCDDHQKQEQEEQVRRDNQTNSLGFDQSFLSNEIVQDVLWSDDVSDLSSFTWQPMVELQEFDSFCGDTNDDQLRISTIDPISDNWASFDLSGFELFSRP